MHRFSRIELRARDVASARDFYRAVLGHDRSLVVAMPDAVAARGVPAHWLGHVTAADVEALAAGFVALGGARLGPTRAIDGHASAVVRDPAGAMLALSARPADPVGDDVAWFGLDTHDLDAASAFYGDRLGWPPTGRIDVGPLGVHQSFAWQEGGPSVGSMFDVRPIGAHPQWVFHFRVDALAPAAAAVRAGGGVVIRELALPSGDALAICDDREGAGFVLRARPR
jgi:predicted enzyme related to lactoylglutathione lyase